MWAILSDEDEKRLAVMHDAVTRMECRGLRIVNVKLPRSFVQRVRAAYEPSPGYQARNEPPTFRGYPIKVVED